jgi:hypothetical protein
MDILADARPALSRTSSKTSGCGARSSTTSTKAAAPVRLSTGILVLYTTLIKSRLLCVQSLLSYHYHAQPSCAIMTNACINPEVVLEVEPRQDDALSRCGAIQPSRHAPRCLRRFCFSLRSPPRPAPALFRTLPTLNAPQHSAPMDSLS